jgi:hypothetical protein
MNPPARTVSGPHLPSSHVPCLSAACPRAPLPGRRRLPPPLSLCGTVQTTPLFLLSSCYCRVGSPISLPLSASSADRRAQAPPLHRIFLKTHTRGTSLSSPLLLVHTRPSESSSPHQIRSSCHHFPSSSVSSHLRPLLPISLGTSPSSSPYLWCRRLHCRR